jgi:hypothetical protein
MPKTYPVTPLPIIKNRKPFDLKKVTALAKEVKAILEKEQEYLEQEQRKYPNSHASRVSPFH